MLHNIQSYHYDIMYGAYEWRNSDILYPNTTNRASSAYIVYRNPLNSSGLVIISTGIQGQDIDLSSFINTSSIEIYGLTAHSVGFPDNIHSVGIYDSIITTMSIPNTVTSLTIRDSPKTYEGISNIPHSVWSISFSGIYIPEFRIPNEASMVCIHHCTIDKITNVEYHIEKETTQQFPMIWIFEDIISPYTLAYIYTNSDRSFTYIQNIYSTREKLYIIKKTNEALSRQYLVETAVRLRLNAFRKETYTSSNKTNDTHVSTISKVMRLGSNYPRRCIEFVDYT